MQSSRCLVFRHVDTTWFLGCRSFREAGLGMRRHKDDLPGLFGLPREEIRWPLCCETGRRSVGLRGTHLARPCSKSNHASGSARPANRMGVREAKRRQLEALNDPERFARISEPCSRAKKVEQVCAAETLRPSDHAAARASNRGLKTMRGKVFGDDDQCESQPPYWVFSDQLVRPLSS
jgi:hypothetical protein